MNHGLTGIARGYSSELSRDPEYTFFALEDRSLISNKEVEQDILVAGGSMSNPVNVIYLYFVKHLAVVVKKKIITDVSFADRFV